MEIGSVVFSKAGRDKGGYYLVVGLSEDPDLFYIADGEYRRLEKPKLKKNKHLRDTGIVLEKLKNKFLDKKTVFDAEIRSALRPFGENKENREEAENENAEAAENTENRE
jgi:ribosomal protein L14E/L6E/L27E